MPDFKGWIILLGLVLTFWFGYRAFSAFWTWMELRQRILYAGGTLPPPWIKGRTLLWLGFAFIVANLLYTGITGHRG